MKVILELHKDLYALPLIHKGIIAYRGLAHITVKEKNEHFVCSFSRCKYDATIRETIRDCNTFVTHYF